MTPEVQDQAHGRDSALSVLLFVGTVVVVTAWAWRPMWDIDIFWHISVGREILDGGIPHTDLFSAAAPERPWTTFQWGYELLVALLEGRFGLGGVRLLHALVVGLALGFWVSWQRRITGSVALALASGVLLLWLFEDRLRVRPQVFELLFVVLLLPLVQQARSGSMALMGVVLAPLWANIHAVSSLWWLALYGAWAVGRSERRAWGIWLLGLLGILSAPGALPGLRNAFSSHAQWPSEFVPELGGSWVYLNGEMWGASLFLGVLAGLGCAVAIGRSEAGRSEKLLAAGCGLASLLLARWAWFAAIPLSLALVRFRPRGLLVLASVAGVLLVTHVAPRWSLADRAEDLQRGSFPVEAADFLDQTGLRLPMDCPGRWAGYLLYRLHPPGRVLADGRLVFSEEVAELLRRRGQLDATTFDEAVDRFHTQLLVWPVGDLPPMDPSRWKRVYADEVAAVWLPSPAWTPANLAAISEWEARAR